MIFVFITFASVMFMQLAYTNCIKKKHYVYLILISMALLIIPATIRSINVGTDVRVYQYPIFRKVFRYENFLDFYNSAKWITSDHLYLILVYFCGKIFRSISALFFFEELLVLSPIYYVVWKSRKHINPVYSLMAYECLFYIETYNVIRQHIAISFFVLGLYFFVECGNKAKYLFYSLIAVGMHQSAFIFPLFLILLRVLDIKSKKNKRLLIVLIIIIVVLMSFYYRPILRFALSKLTFLPARYGGKRYLSIDKINFPAVDMAVMAFGTIVLLLCRMHNINDRRIEWILLMNYFVFATCYFAMMVEFGSRILWYFKIFNIFSFGYGIKIIRNDTLSRIIYFFAAFIFLSFYWIYIYYISGSAGVFPYEIAESFRPGL